MSRKRRVFGPLFYATLALAALVLVGLRLWELWPAWQQRRELRSLASDLRSPTSFVHRYARDQLAGAGSAAVPWLIEATSNPDAGVRLLAYSALGETLPKPKMAIPALVAGLRDPDVRIRRQAADALGRLGYEAGEGVDGLIGALEDDDLDVRFRAARALERVGGRAGEPALRALLGLLADPIGARFPDRPAIIPIVRGMGPDAESRAIAALIPLVAAGDRPARRSAIECLQILGPRARDATSALEKKAAGDPDLMTRCLAASALSEIEGWERGRARQLLGELVDRPAIPPRMRKQVSWVLTAELTNGSEIWQPVHTLRALVDELKLVERRVEPGPEADPDLESEAIPPGP